MEETQKLITSEGDLPPPPAYQQKATAGDPHPPKYITEPLPLPTYDQSEKFGKEGVSRVSSESDSSEATAPPVRRWSPQNGSCFEFTLFFTVCALFSVVGFLFSFCLATTTAAQSGAVAGLGAAFITKPFLYEFYYKGYEQQWSKNWCAGYGSEGEIERCMQWSTTTMRTTFFVIGLFGLLLLFKGFSTFFRSRGSSSN